MKWLRKKIINWLFGTDFTTYEKLYAEYKRTSEELIKTHELNIELCKTTKDIINICKDSYERYNIECKK